ncbi:MAG: ribulose-phosphate 3-epimerase [Deltaproteobacteria bacterium]|jgi:ribulose-phosphate 3-epimerase|nr:ribulose-phosphate 3-epimerase [Deltaproteobacteria bacterium]MCL5880404.1 ribulose-phosphate 3-epimerase [Deltaproteobacteria bacterium]MDA8303668.1 ribulose-phosphate 3-epimerase [Deltaproteobacteria bacterium]
MKKIAPSILSGNLLNLAAELELIKEAGADLIHIDIMDGIFVPNITAGWDIVSAIKSGTDIPLDVHLMIDKPERYIEEFVKSGADILTIHQEGCIHLHRAVEKIRELGASPGVAINPSTPISALDEILDYIDLVLIMSVNPGFSGQEFIYGSLFKIENMRKIIAKRELETLIEVDGGIKVLNIADVANSGANIIVSGSGIFKTDDYKKTIMEMKERI